MRWAIIQIPSMAIDGLRWLHRCPSIEWSLSTGKVFDQKREVFDQKRKVFDQTRKEIVQLD